MPVQRPVTPSKRAARTTTPVAPRRSSRLTPTPSLGPGRSRSPSSAPSVPSIPSPTHSIRPPNKQADWLARLKAHDPIFGSDSQLRLIEQACGCSIQPPEHCYPHVFPTLAEKYGLERFIPKGKLVVGSKGPKCLDKGKRGLVCHKQSLPAFLYSYIHQAQTQCPADDRSDKFHCPVAEQRGLPTMIFRWKSEADGSAHLQACWSCHTSGGRSRCALIGMNMPRLLPIDEDTKPKQRSALLEHPVPAVGTRRRIGPTAGSEGERDIKRIKVNDNGADGRDGVSMQSAAPPVSITAPIQEPTLPGAIQADPVAIHVDKLSDLPNMPKWKEYAINMKRRDRSRTPSAELQRLSEQGYLHVPSSEISHLSVGVAGKGLIRPGSAPPTGETSTSLSALLPAPQLPEQRHVETSELDRLLSDVPQGNKVLEEISLEDFRGRIDRPFRTLLTSAEEYQSALKKAQAEYNGVFEDLFRTYNEMSIRAGEDRTGINAVRSERDSLKATLKAYDQRLVSYTTRAEQDEKEASRLKTEIDQLRQELQQRKEEQEAFDKRMTLAVIEKDKAIAERDQAVKDCESYRQSASRAILERAEALRAQDEAERALADAMEENETLSRKFAGADARRHELEQLSTSSLLSERLWPNTSIRSSMMSAIPEPVVAADSVVTSNALALQVTTTDQAEVPWPAFDTTVPSSQSHQTALQTSNTTSAAFPATGSPSVIPEQPMQQNARDTSAQVTAVEEDLSVADIPGALPTRGTIGSRFPWL